MSVAKLKKAILHYHVSIQEEVLFALQRLGACEIIHVPPTPDDCPVSQDVLDKLAESESLLTELRYLSRFLEPRYQDPVSSIARTLGEKPVYSLRELKTLADGTDIRAISDSVRNLERKQMDLRMELSQIHNELQILQHFQFFPYTLDVFSSKSQVLKGVLGTISSDQLPSFTEELEKKVNPYYELYTANKPAKGENAWIALIYSKEKAAEVSEISARYGFTLSELDRTEEKMAVSVMEDLRELQAALQTEEDEVAHSIAETAEKKVPDLRLLLDYWSIYRDRYQTLAAGCYTDSTVKTEFWIPEIALPGLKKSLAAIGNASALVLSDPAPEDEPPTLLQNNAWARSYETLTELYSPPKYGALDPTPFLAPFFFVFFGMCLGDAGYAVVIAGAIWMVMKKFPRMPANMKEFAKIFLFVSGSTFLYGMITGSFFGDLIGVAPFLAPLRGLRDSLTLMDPMQDPVLVLGISLAFGVVHLFFGMFLALYIRIKNGEYVDAIGDQGAWLTFISGLMLIGGCAAGALPQLLWPLAYGATLVGMVIIIWYGGREKKNIFSKLISGVLSLYNATSWLGDILSYSRLLALGLASAAVGMIINMLGGLASDIPYVGWLVAVLIVVGGHLFSLAINVLGAFVHSLRLQYVEFFGKFYTGGGRTLVPFACKTQYVEISDCGDTSS